MAYTDRDDLNTLGVLYQIGTTKTPFLNAIGGLSKGKETNSFHFSTGQTWSVTPTIPNVSEDVAVAGTKTVSNKSRTGNANTCQIFQEIYKVSYAKESTYKEIGTFSGGITGTSIMGDQPVTSEMSFQQAAALKQIAGDMDYTFINGTLQVSTDSSIVAKTEGILSAIDTYEVNAGGLPLDKIMFDSLLISMSANAYFDNPIILVNGYQMVQLSNIYGFAPDSLTVGGVALQYIITNFGKFAIMWDPNMPTTTLAVVDMSVIGIMYCPVKGKYIIDEPLAKVGASDQAQYYLQAGLDYGPEKMHGSLINLADS
jgi:hypothetical protein